MKNQQIITESTRSMRSLMERLGANLIKEDAAPVAASTKKPLPMDLQKPIFVNVNTKMCRVGNSMMRKTFVNYDITEFADTYGPKGVEWLKNNMIKGVAIRSGEKVQPNVISINPLPRSGETQISYEVRNSAQENQFFAMHNLMDTAFKGNITMSAKATWEQVETAGKIDIANTESQAFLEGKFGGILKNASLMWKALLEKNPNTPEEDIRVVGPDGVEVSMLLDPRETYGHQLSGLNRCLIVAQAQAYQVPTPRFVCKRDMISAHVPYGFERKFRDDIEQIHPYYVRFVSEHKPSKKGLMNMYSGNDVAQEMIANNPQVYDELSIQYGTHDAKYYGWCEYYDIDETVPMDPNNDVFENTIGQSDNLQHVANDYTQKIQQDLNNGEKVKEEPEVETEVPETTPKYTSVFNAKDLMKGVCDKLGCPEAYQKQGYKDDSDDENVALAQLRNITLNLCRKLISYHGMSKANKVDAFAGIATELVLSMLNIEKTRKVNMSNVNNVVRNVVDKIHKAALEVNNQQQVGGLGESVLGRSLLAVLNNEIN